MNSLESFSLILEAFLLIGKFFVCLVESSYRLIVPPPMKSIDGETILVTGAVGGIGKEICKQLIRSGNNLKLVLWDLNEVDLETFKKDLLEFSRNSSKESEVFTFAVDISERKNIDKAAEEVKNTVGSVSILFNNAGIAPTANFIRFSNKDIEKTIQVNLMSHFWIIRQFLPEMAKRNHGRIVNICSMSALVPGSHSFPYAASKYGVNGYTESLKLELSMLNYDGVKLSTVYPYFVNTSLVRNIGIDKSTKGIVPPGLNQFLKPEDVAKSAVDGMRREYEYIYCPSTVPLVAFARNAVPVNFRRHFERTHFKSIAFNSPEEEKKFSESYIM